MYRCMCVLGLSYARQKSFTLITVNIGPLDFTEAERVKTTNFMFV